jgi:hypothetical protein
MAVVNDDESNDSMGVDSGFDSFKGDDSGTDDDDDDDDDDNDSADADQDEEDED